MSHENEKQQEEKNCSEDYLPRKNSKAIKASGNQLLSSMEDIIFATSRTLTDYQYSIENMLKDLEELHEATALLATRFGKHND